MFPEGGGQPSDTGLIQTANEKVWKVLQARRHGGHAVHYVQVENAEVDILQFTVGTQVLVKLGDADWDRRCDHVMCHNSLDFVVVTLSFADDYAHLPTPFICCARRSSEHPDALLVFDGSTGSMLR